MDEDIDENGKFAREPNVLKYIEDEDTSELAQQYGAYYHPGNVSNTCSYESLQSFIAKGEHPLVQRTKDLLENYEAVRTNDTIHKAWASYDGRCEGPHGFAIGSGSSSLLTPSVGSNLVSSSSTNIINGSGGYGPCEKLVNQELTIANTGDMAHILSARYLAEDVRGGTSETGPRLLATMHSDVVSEFSAVPSSNAIGCVITWSSKLGGLREYTVPCQNLVGQKITLVGADKDIRNGQVNMDNYDAVRRVMRVSYNDLVTKEVETMQPIREGQQNSCQINWPSGPESYRSMTGSTNESGAFVDLYHIDNVYGQAIRNARRMCRENVVAHNSANCTQYDPALCKITMLDSMSFVDERTQKIIKQITKNDDDDFFYRPNPKCIALPSVGRNFHHDDDHLSQQEQIGGGGGGRMRKASSDAGESSSSSSSSLGNNNMNKPETSAGATSGHPSNGSVGKSFSMLRYMFYTTVLVIALIALAFLIRKMFFQQKKDLPNDKPLEK